jgi:hypothetical protein
MQTANIVNLYWTCTIFSQLLRNPPLEGMRQRGYTICWIPTKIKNPAVRGVPFYTKRYLTFSGKYISLLSSVVCLLSLVISNIKGKANVEIIKQRRSAGISFLFQFVATNKKKKSNKTNWSNTVRPVGEISKLDGV